MLEEKEVIIEPEPIEQEIGVDPEQFVVNVNFDYETSKNKPQINGKTLTGNKTSKELDLQHIMTPLTNEEIEKIMKGEI